VSVKRAYDGAGDEGGAGPGASYERVTIALPAGGAGSGGSRAGNAERHEDLLYDGWIWPRRSTNDTR